MIYGIPDPKNVMSSWWIKPEKSGMVVIYKASYVLEEEGDIGGVRPLDFLWHLIVQRTPIYTSPQQNQTKWTFQVSDLLCPKRVSFSSEPCEISGFVWCLL